MGWLIAGAVVLLIFAGLAASADTALLRLSRPGAKDLAAAGRDPSPQLRAALADVPRYIAVLLFARVGGELAAILFVLAAALHWFGTGWQVYVVTGAILTVVVYLVAGLVPRILGREYAVSVAGSAARVLQPVVRLLGPLPGMALATARALGRGRTQPGGPPGAEEDLGGLVDLLGRRRFIEPGERAMINSVVALADTIVREVMVPRTDMIFLDVGKTLRQAQTLALRSGFSRIPVVGENLDDIVGIAYLKDIVTRTFGNAASLQEPVSSLMRPATFVPDSKPVDDLLREMQAERTHAAIVIDEYGGTAGLVTIEDILEEIVGEIADEYDTEAAPVEWLSKDNARVTARLPVDELAELFGVTIKADDVETVGGLLAQRLGRIPIADSTAVVSGLRLTAENPTGRRNRISTVLVRRVRGDDTAGATASANADGVEGGSQ
jgi:CBS domain containing-hemolysin-like protein